jgi:hypothetical protein
MISQALITWFQEEIKKSIADVIEEEHAPTFAVSLHDNNGIVWIEGLIHTTVEPHNEPSEYLVQYSIQRDEDLPEECPFSVTITIIDD